LGSSCIQGCPGQPVLADAIHLTPPNAGMAASIDLDVAQRTSVVHLPKVLAEADLDKVRLCQRRRLDGGMRPQQHQHKRRTFMHGGVDGLQASAPDVVAKLLGAAAKAKELGGWGARPGGPLRDVDVGRLWIRVAELWEYEPGGGLVDDHHYDDGSVVTIVCLVDKAADLTGGVFRTFESDGTHAEHALDCGDVLCLLSHKYHNVTPVQTGHRHSLVLELWQDSEGDRCARMAADEESGFVACGGLGAARHAISGGKTKLEFAGISTRSELAECLQFVEELLADQAGTDRRPLRGLGFASCKLSSDDLGRLARVLQSGAGRKLTAFGISKNKGLDHNAWRELVPQLPKKAKCLDFGDNELTDKDLALLLGSLAGFKKLERVYLDGNKLEDLSSLCRALPGTCITDLDLGDNSIDDTNMAMLSAALTKTSVKLLVLGTNPLGTSGIMSLFNTLPCSCIEVLYLDHTGADDACLAALSNVLRHSQLTELHLDSTRITDEGVRRLIPHVAGSELRFLDAAGNGLSDATAAALEGATSRARGAGPGAEGAK